MDISGAQWQLASARERRVAGRQGQVRLRGPFPIDRCSFNYDGSKIFATGKTTGQRSREGMRNILSCICHVLIDICGKYPHQDDVEEASFQLVRKVPGAQLTYPTEKGAMRFWRRSLGQKLRNMRRPHPADSNYQKDEEMSSRAKLGQQRRTSVTHGNRKRPATTPSDHEDLYALLQVEMAQSTRNMETVLCLMEKTFQGRQKEFGDTKPHIADALARYPALQDISVMKQELRLVTGVGLANLEWDTKLDQMATVVLTHAEELANRVRRDHPLRTVVMRRGTTSRNAKVLKALMALPYLLPSTSTKDTNAHEYLVQVTPIGTSSETIRSVIPDLYTPFLVAVESEGKLHHFSIYTEQHHLTDTLFITDAVFATICPTYMMDYTFDPRIKPTMNFLISYLLGQKQKLLNVAEAILNELDML